MVLPPAWSQPGLGEGEPATTAMRFKADKTADIQAVNGRTALWFLPTRVLTSFANRP